MLKVDCHFKNPLTGEVVVYQDSFDWPEDYGAIFMYTEGNYSCDCNRSDFMGIEELPCGDTIELVKIVEHGTDRVIWPEPPTDLDKYPGLAKTGFVFQI